jgi:Sulfotransferase family
MAVEISGVTLCPSNDLINAARLDYPRTGPVDGYAFYVYGWVVSKAPVAEVEFVHAGIVIACCELTVSRPDVATAYGSSSPVGFWKVIGTVGLPPAFTIGVRVVFQDGRRREIAEIRGTQQLTSAFIPSIQPIMVSTLGRSGGTWLMRMLAEHPDIIVHERFPYGETYVCSYWMHFVHVLAAPVGTSQVESLQFWTDPERLPRFPYAFLVPDIDAGSLGATADRWYATDHVEEFARVAQAAVESFYREYASSRKRPTPAFFAEKSVQQKGVRPGHYDWTMRRLYPRGREIFLVRDPRDTLASVLAFNARRGFDAFGRERVETDEQYVDVIRTRMLLLVQTWKSTSHRGPLVRYEDLVRSPTEQITAMLDALELDSSANIVDAMVKAGNEATADVNAHKTSPDGPSSIGRWKRDLEPRLQKICDEAFDGLLDELGGGY